jgi:NAD(P)-dependent dehydrogenase (short-subunit alcohol dehydrogenase family)
MRVCIVTGGNSGVGLYTSLGLAKLGYHVFIGCRSQQKAMRAIEHIYKVTGNPKVEYLPLNLASLESVRQCVQIFNSRNLPLHILVNNAGIFHHRGTTQEGFELIWGTNYLGHFLLTYLLLDKLQAAAPSRIIMVSSDLALKPTNINWNLFTKNTPLNFLEAYNQSKFCLLVLTNYLAQYLQRSKSINQANQIQDNQVTVHAVHPGFVRSNITIGHRLSRYLGLGISPEQGAYSSLLCATSPDFALVTGKFIDPKGQEIILPTIIKNQDLGQELWEKSLDWTGENQEIQSIEKQRIIYDGIDGIWGPYALELTPEAMTEISHHIFQKVLPHPPQKTLLLQALKSLARLQFGSIMLLIVQCYKRQFYMERHLDSEAVWKICTDVGLLQVVKEHLGADLQLWRSELWVNYPSGQLIPFWHQDLYPHLLQGSGKTINIYIALTEVQATNGFEYIPIDQVSNCQVKIIDPFSGNHFFQVPQVIEKAAIPVILKAGEFVLFNDQLVHRSVYNRSGKVRLSLTLRVAPSTMKFLPGYTSNYQKPKSLPI